MPLYCPPSGVPEDYSVAILQMFQCYLRQLRRCRYQSLGERGWASPIRPGPHLPKYLIHRRRGVRVPPDEDDEDTNPEDGVQGEEDEGIQQNQEASQRVNKYVLDESDDDFELANVSGRRKQVPDVERNNKRPRSEPRGNEDVASHHPIVCPKPIRRPPESVPRPDVKGNNSHPSQGHTVPNKGRPPTPPSVPLISEVGDHRGLTPLRGRRETSPSYQMALGTEPGVHLRSSGGHRPIQNLAV
ncbi:hypothetical protein BSL78_09392 [Apostichopus japonicus]|uniref:Uncharacterized protein n=1 Tax=Stichopus japonicus TaxID=307972 RepID=A0A2G8L0C3_STIJA|nr:hypothetical protein BSL78_09392 [Apostichopus japonicus]